MEEEKVSIIGLFRTLYQKKRLIYKITGIFLVIGIVYYIFSPREYNTSATLLSESSSSGLSGLSGLASLAGVNLGNNIGGSDGINSSIYEKVLNSTPFLDKLVTQKFFFPSINKTLSLSEYLVDYSKKPVLIVIKRAPTLLTSKFSGWFSKKGGQPAPYKADTIADELLFSNKVLQLQGKDRAAIRELKDRITYSQDLKSGLIELDFELQDKMVAAQVMKQIIDELSSYVINYQTQKTRRSLIFTDEQIAKSKKKYSDAQMRLASFNDRNRNVLFSVPKTEGDRLQAQLNLEFNVYNSLLQQREQLRLKVANETPAITVIEPAQVSSAPYKPNLFFIIMISLFLGFFIGSTWVLVKNTIIEITR
jgi:uncharacterized protein involved in exopolysaccharide biosynthesis